MIDRYVLCRRLFIVATFSFFFFNDTATTEIYTLSLHDALPICVDSSLYVSADQITIQNVVLNPNSPTSDLMDVELKSYQVRSEEHTSELQSRLHLVCRLLLEKKNKKSTASPLQKPTTTSRTIQH